MGKLFYRKYKNNNQHSSGFGKYYGRAIITETVEIEEIANRMQDNCTVKRADILAVLSELGPTIADLVKDSKRVRIPYLGCFKLGLSTKGEADADKFNAKDNVKDVHVIFQPETKASEKGRRVKTMTEGVQVVEEPSAKTKTTPDEEPDGEDNGD